MQHPTNHLSKTLFIVCLTLSDDDCTFNNNEEQNDTHILFSSPLSSDLNYTGKYCDSKHKKD